MQGQHPESEMGDENQHVVVAKSGPRRRVANPVAFFRLRGSNPRRDVKCTYPKL